MNLHDVQVNGKPIKYIAEADEWEDEEKIGGEEGNRENLVNGLSEEVGGGMQAVLPPLPGFMSPRRVKLQRRQRAIMAQMEQRAVRRRNMRMEKLD